jgi:hypothetical protein
MLAPKKIWTLDEALEVFPRIKEITEDFYKRSNSISKLLAEKIYPENEMEKMEDEIHELVRVWNFTMLEFEVDVKGIWLVDFDNGRGYYCWKIGEEDLLYEHSYEEGFRRKKID